jgi:glutaredoxin-related protein
VELEYEKITSTNIAAATTAAATTIATNDTHEDDNDNKDEKKKSSSSSSSMTFDELRDIKLFEDSLHYIGIPVLMQDNDGDIIGVWSHKVANMRHSSGSRRTFTDESGNGRGGGGWQMCRRR